MSYLTPDLGHLLLGLLFLTSLLLNLHFARRDRTTATSQPSPRHPEPTPNHQESVDSIRRHDIVSDTIDETGLAKFVRLHEDITEEIEFLHAESQEADSMKEILVLLTQALNDCGVEQFSPAVGESYRTAFGVAPNPEFIPTTNRSDEWNIVRVVRPGLRIDSPRRRCLKEARVAVYKYQRME